MTRSTKLKLFLASVFKRLSTTKELTDICEVYDWVPEGVPMPYVTFGYMNITKDNTKTVYGSNISIDILVWDNTTGRQRSLDITEAIERAFDTDLEFENGLELVSQGIEYLENVEQEYGLYNTIIRLRCRVEDEED
ncbi:MAG: DUF3168 domain-containing protein [Clostridium sp.]|uniref:DUF3168 domain-containing protein n=1 Tax=Clostridium sp. TaxID=1506 RepID=UPI003F3228B7